MKLTVTFKLENSTCLGYMLSIDRLSTLLLLYRKSFIRAQVESVCSKSLSQMASKCWFWRLDCPPPHVCLANFNIYDILFSTVPLTSCPVDGESHLSDKRHGNQTLLGSDLFNLNG